MQAAQRGDLALVNLFLRAPKRVTEPCVTRSLLLAADNGWLPVVLCLVQAGADGDNENASALMATHPATQQRIDRLRNLGA